MTEKSDPMSANCDFMSCPSCKVGTARLDRWHDPFLYTTMTCLECGFSIRPEVFYLDITEINEERKMIRDSWIEPSEKEMFEFIPLGHEDLLPRCIEKIDEIIA